MEMFGDGLVPHSFAEHVRKVPSQGHRTGSGTVMTQISLAYTLLRELISPHSTTVPSLLPVSLGGHTFLFVVSGH